MWKAIIGKVDIVKEQIGNRNKEMMEALKKESKEIL